MLHVTSDTRLKTRGYESFAQGRSRPDHTRPDRRRRVGGSLFPAAFAEGSRSLDAANLELCLDELIAAGLLAAPGRAGRTGGAGVAAGGSSGRVPHYGLSSRVGRLDP